MGLYDLLFDIPTYIALIIYIIIVIVFSLLGAILYTYSGLQAYHCSDGISILSIFISIISIFLGVMISLIIAQANSNYTSAVADSSLEASAIYSLWNVIRHLPDSEALQDEVVLYLEYIIHVEYPALKRGDLPPLGDQMVAALSNAILTFGETLTRPKDLQLWGMANNLMASVQNHRLSRLTYASYGVNNLLWITAVMDSIILIILTWLINCTGIFRYIYISIAAIYVASSLFAVTIISFPFRGYNALTPIPFEQALSAIMGTKPAIKYIPLRNRSESSSDGWDNNDSIDNIGSIDDDYDMPDLIAL